MFWLRVKKLRQIITDPYLVSALIKGAAAGMEHGPVLQALYFDLIVDIGANRGQFALIARKTYPKAKILSFEPLEEPSKIFKKIFSHDPNVTLYPYAIGRQQTTATIHVTKDDDSSSMLPISKIQSDMFPGASEKETRQVLVSPLSQLISSASIPLAALLKIDVQGFELEVLQGCEDILQKFSHLYVECSFMELYEGQSLAYQIIAWLEKRDFMLIGVHNMFYGKHGTAIQGDFLFARK